VSNVPSLTPLTQPRDRGRAEVIVAGALRCTLVEATTLLNTVDALTAAVLRIAGLDEASIRAAMAALWEHPVRSAPAGTPVTRLRITDREREFLRDLGGRIHVVRRARRIETPAVRRLTSIPGEQLADLERGIAVPSILALYRISDTLQTPLPLLVDEKQTPVDLLRALAARERAGE
jgi:hypothetical protein